MYRFSKKLKQLKPMNSCFEKLCDKQRSTLANPGEVAAQEEAEAQEDAYEKCMHVANLEADFLK